MIFRPIRLPTYGIVLARVQQAAALYLTIACILGANLALGTANAADKPVKIVVLGDSLSAGYGLPIQDAFPSKLAVALKAKGYTVDMVNAGVSGDTSTGGLDRFDWSVPPDADALILEFGANDALRGVNPDVARTALDKMMQKAAERKLPVLLAGMKAPPNLGADYVAKFDSIYPALAKTYGAILYPFFLEGVAADRKLNQPDGLHPVAAGIDIIVERIMPQVEELIAKVKAKAS